MTKKMKDSLEI